MPCHGDRQDGPGPGRNEGHGTGGQGQTGHGHGDQNTISHGPHEGTDELVLEVAPHGPTSDDVSPIFEMILQHPRVQLCLQGTEHRVLSVGLLENQTKARTACPPERFRATIYDYTNSRTLVVEGDLAGLDPDSPEDVQVSEHGSQPRPSEEEFDAAVHVMMRDPGLRAAISNGEIRPYRPMPPLVNVELPDGRADRALAVGLLSEQDQTHRFVGVNMYERRILDDLDDVVLAGPGRCEPPPGVDPCAATGSAGQVWVTVSRGGETLWRFLAIRPAASSGSTTGSGNGSGIELRYVDYRGKRVLYQAHLPILNVEYFADGIAARCGPTYRDWQDAEACFQAPLGYDVIPGYRVCSGPATTIIDTGDDSGNFRGVAIYVQGQEVVLVSEVKAGWYRYVSEWRFDADGTIRPRWGFAGTDNPCTCHLHHHHAYWRFDFDIRTASNNVVEEFNDPPIVGSSNWHTKTYEIRRPRDPAHKRHWRVSNASTGEGYLLVPGAHDGNQTPYGLGDLWVLRYNSSEMDDGQGFTSDAALSMAHIDRFRDPAELVANTDVVLWYAGHFLHDASHTVGDRVGPDLVPVNW